MKKLLVTCLLFLFSVATLGMNAFAVAVPEASNDDVIRQVAEDFLAQSTTNIYLYESNDLAALSISSLPATCSDGSVLLDIGEERVSLGDCRAVMELAEEKAAYYQYLRSSQGFIVNDFTQTYTFKDLRVDGDTAVAAVNEFLTWQYADYHLPSGASIDYEITLIRRDGQWLVAQAIAPTELFDQKYLISGEPFDLAAELDAIDTYLETGAAAIRSAQERRYDFATPSLTAAGYSVSKAAFYARTWALKRSSVFIDFTNDGGDCRSFASQCIYAGLGGPTTSANTSYMEKSVENKWYWNDYGAWCSCSKFRAYVNGANAILNTDVFELFSTYGIPFWYPGNIDGSVAHGGAGWK